MEVHAGVVTAAEVNGPMATADGTKWLDFDSPATWATLWFLIACIFLFVL